MIMACHDTVLLMPRHGFPHASARFSSCLDTVSLMPQRNFPQALAPFFSCFDIFFFGVLERCLSGIDLLRERGALLMTACPHRFAIGRGVMTGDSVHTALAMTCVASGAVCSLGFLCGMPMAGGACRASKDVLKCRTG